MMVKLVQDSLVQPFSKRRKDALQLRLGRVGCKTADEAYCVLRNVSDRTQRIDVECHAAGMCPTFCAVAEKCFTTRFCRT
jgi:hypothetical protein